MNRERVFARIGVAALWIFGVGLLGALLVPVLGLAPLQASSGHWAATQWLLEFVKHRSVATQSPNIEPPDLTDRGLVTLGAGHYETGCRVCHGAPGQAMPVVPGQALPPPPYLAEIAERYEPQELFFIIRHGIKFTGMPAWPAPERAEEIWAVVAFVELFPQLSASDYARWISEGETSLATRVPSAVREACGRCHGQDGLGRVGEHAPILAGQKVEYLIHALDAYATGQRPSGMMQPVAARLSGAQRREVAAWYAARPAPKASKPSGEGRALVEQGVPARKIPSCVDCHRPEANPAYPLLDGQPGAYLRRQLALFASGGRGGSDFAQLMEEVAVHALTAREIDAVVDYYAVE